MKLHSGISAKHLLQMLGESLHKEQGQWKPVTYKMHGNEHQEVLGQHRDEIVSWIIYQNNTFHFSPETVCLSIYLLDKFLQHVKVRPKYLHCVTISCYFIAAKTLEEDEVIPCTVDLVKRSQVSCSVAEILRMEAVILNKLNWNIKYVTATDFLHILHAMLMCYHPQLLDGLSDMTPSQHLGVLTRKLFFCLSNHRLQNFKPSVLCLAILSLELEQITQNWFSIMLMIQQMAGMDNKTLVWCRELVSRFLVEKHLLPTGYHFLPHHPLRRIKTMKRKAEQVESDEEVEDDISDAIKRLYNDDSSCDGSLLRASCGSELHQDTEGTGGQLKPTPVAAN
ncbi:cyclin-I-like [Argopecten irradians]|uniref:cyclin-I-like n=1 Tax=Argopecten irradians TaxID=31199 RepID=UPI00371E442A